MTRPAKDDPRMMTGLSVVDAMRAKRTALHLSLRQLAVIVGVSFSELARLERRESLPSRHTQRCLQAWLTPDIPGVSCHCARCLPVHRPAPADLEARLTVLEARMTALETGNRSSVMPHKRREEETP